MLAIQWGGLALVRFLQIDKIKRLFTDEQPEEPDPHNIGPDEGVEDENPPGHPLIA